MSLMRQVWLGCVVCLTLVGCANANRAKVASVKRVFIEDTKLSTQTNATIDSLTPAVMDSAAIELTRHGYVVVSSKALAEGVLRLSWQTGVDSSSGSAESPLSLSMTLFNQKGKRVFSGNSGPSIPVAFWSQTRATSAVASILGPMPAAVTVAE